MSSFVRLDSMSQGQTDESAAIWRNNAKPDLEGNHKGYGSYSQSKLDSESTLRTDDGQYLDVLIFRPNLYFPKLVIYNNHNISDGAKLLIDRRLVLVCTARFETNWYYVKSGKISGWIAITSQMDKRKSVQPIKILSRHELWRGNNYFFLGGRVMTSYDLPLFRYNSVTATYQITHFVINNNVLVRPMDL